MDTLTFGAPVLLKNLTASEQKKLPVTEISLEHALQGLDMSKEQFTDLCLLLGCDYLDPITVSYTHLTLPTNREV